MIDPQRMTAALCFAWNVNNIAQSARTNADFDAALWHALETFGADLADIRRCERRATFTVVDGGDAA